MTRHPVGVLRRNRSRFGRPSLATLIAREAAPNTFAGSERRPPLPRRPTLSARGFSARVDAPETLPFPSLKASAAARQRNGLDPRMTPRCHSSGAASVLRTGPLSQLGIGSARGQSQRTIHAIAGCHFKRPGRETLDQSSRTRSGTLTQRDQAGSGEPLTQKCGRFAGLKKKALIAFVLGVPQLGHRLKRLGRVVNPSILLPAFCFRRDSLRPS